MSRGDVEVQQTVGGWRIVLQGVYATQVDAERQADNVAGILRVERHTRGLLGRILRRNSYGGDPRNVKG